ncbi:HlyD family type I secretion periplasmic adaptor subunit [bacterium]|nr:HlyD family type I secretion periplasmic adaptor subunit [bacterium]
MTLSSVTMPTANAPAELTLPENVQPLLRAGWLTLWFGLVGFLLWASLAPLDKGVSAPGSVVVEGERKTVLQLTGGQVARIAVSDGQFVQRGQLLVEMNRVPLQAKSDALTAQYYSALARQSRLQAESLGHNRLLAPPNTSLDDELHTALASEQQLLQARLSARSSSLAALDESIAANQQQLAGVAEILTSKLEQKRTLDAQLNSLRRLSDDRFATETQVLEMERRLAEVQSSIAEDRAMQGTLQRQIAEARLRKQVQIEDDRQSVLSQLAETNLSVQTLDQQLQMARYELDNTRVTAPVDGTVMNLNVHTEGGFIAVNTHLLDVVPSGQRLEVQAQIPVDQVDSVQSGLAVDLIFSAFNRNTTPRIPARVETVSADRLVNAQTGLPYYQVNARVTPDGMALLEDYQVRPGMPVEVFIKIGERSLMSYLLQPIRDRWRLALTEV